MSARRGFALHPLAAQYITDIWTYIADDSPQTARPVREELFVAVMHGRRSPRVMAAILRSRQ
jgi:plasmid stabilization system protein ParE